MTYTVQQLISDSYYLSSIVSRQFQTVSGTQRVDGLRLLNNLLSFQTANSGLVPYFSQYNLTAVVNQEKYFIPNLIELETLTFNIGPVRYSMSPQSRRAYFGSGRIDNVSSLPFNYRVERTLNGSDFYVYFLPSQTYPLILWGKFSLGEVTENQDLLLTLDRFYIEYLRFALAEYICLDSNVPFSAENRKKLESMVSDIYSLSPPDYTMTKMSSLTSSNPLNWGDINAGKGWRP